jgi:hypothetical protein
MLFAILRQRKLPALEHTGSDVEKSIEFVLLAPRRAIFQHTKNMHKGDEWRLLSSSPLNFVDPGDGCCIPDDDGTSLLFHNSLI